MNSEITHEQIGVWLGLAKLDYFSTDPKQYEAVFKLPPGCPLPELKFFRSSTNLAFETLCEFSRITKTDPFAPIDDAKLAQTKGFQKFAKLVQSVELSYRRAIVEAEFENLLTKAVKSVGYERLIEMVNLAAIRETLES